MWLGISLFHLFFLRYIICWGSVDSCFSYQFYKFTAIIFKITFFSSIWYILDLSFHSPCPISQFFSITSSLCMIVLIWDNFLRYIFQYANSLFYCSNLLFYLSSDVKILTFIFLFLRVPFSPHLLIHKWWSLVIFLSLQVCLCSSDISSSTSESSISRDSLIYFCCVCILSGLVFVLNKFP